MSFFFDFEAHDKKAIPVAKVHGGEYNHQTLYLNDTKAVMASKRRNSVDVSPYDDALKGFKAREKSEMLRKVKEAYVKGIDVEHFLGTEAEKELLTTMNTTESRNTHVLLPPDCSFRLIHTSDPKVRQIFYIAGGSGSGKSWIARSIAESYYKCFPGRKVYLISQLKEDETLDNMKGGKPIRLDLDQLVARPPELKEMKDSLWLFDDYDTLRKPYDAMCKDLIERIAIMGRHETISMCCMSHYLTNYSKTRLILSEATHFVLYPQSTGAKPLSYLLGTYLGMENKEIAALKKLGRWIMVHKNYPPFLISEHTAKLLNV